MRVDTPLLYTSLSLSYVLQAACTAIAILLHYTWLVSFMWMLMEGVVLYVALVKVFDVQHLRYGILFTIISYGETIILLSYSVELPPLSLSLSPPSYPLSLQVPLWCI